MAIPQSEDERRSVATPLNFSELESLRLLCKQIKPNQVTSLNYFRSGVGFMHVRGRDKEGDVSVSSSATCVLSLAATGEWNSSEADTASLAKKLIDKEKSAGLDKDNPFTTAWILDAVTALERDVAYPFVADTTYKAKIAHKEGVLQDAIRKSDDGAVSIAGYPGSAYLTQLVVRVLRRREKLPPELEDKVNGWAWAEMTRQLALVQARSKTRDAFSFAYLLMLVTSGTPSSEISPEKSSFQRASLQTVFNCQLQDGTWPLSRPLFHYPTVGNAHCYEFEMLTQLLQEPGLRDLLIDYLPNLRRAAESLSRSVYELDSGVRAWASGHHPQLPGPESWTTASVYHFVHNLDRILAEAVRRDLFQYLETPFPGPMARGYLREEFASRFLDSKVKFHGNKYSLKEHLWQLFVSPLMSEAASIANGRRFSKETPRSAIFFGPPGTSKTDLSKEIAGFLGWPYLAVDPSHFLRNGMDGIQAEANIVFRRLEETERIVVLFDEFDELVRQRDSPNALPFSRLLTTAMLPKLARLHKQGTIVFIIATNHIGEFDLAIRRRGRFDRGVQIMPPTYDAKTKGKKWGPQKIDLGEKLSEFGLDADDDVKSRVGDLTYDECESFASELRDADTVETVRSKLTNAWSRCTLNTPVSEEEKATWKQRCEDEEKFNF
jgi:hypothetical protein